jgi:hypothetical protein
MLRVLVGQPEGLVPQILSQVGVAPQALVDELTREVAAKPLAMRLLQGQSHTGDVVHIDRGQAGLEFAPGTAGWDQSPHG